MKKTLLMMGIALTAFASCSQDEIKEVKRGDAIDFRTPSLTKATETTTGNLTEFYVSAYVPENNETSYYSDQKYTKMVDHYVSTPEYLWPADGSTLNFYAYSPSAEKLGSTPQMSDQGDYTLTYEPAVNISEHVDLITATATGSSANTQAGVILEFGHRLAQIQVDARSSDPNHVIKVKGVKIANVIGKGTLDFKTGDWSFDQTPTYQSYEATYQEAKTLRAESVSLMNSVTIDDRSLSDNAMVIPQTCTAWNPESPDKGGVYIGVLVNITTAEGAQVYPQTAGEYDWVATPISDEWAAGKKYYYHLDFTSGAGYDATTGTTVNEDIEYTLSVASWSEMDVQKQIYADLIGTWKAYKFDHIDYYTDSEQESSEQEVSQKVESINTLYADHSEYTTYDMNGVKTHYTYNSATTNIEESYTNGKLTTRIEKNSTLTITITYDENGNEIQRTEVEANNSFSFDENALTNIAGGGFAYFKIPEENSNLIIVLNPDGSESETSISFTMDADNFMIIPALDGQRTVPHVDEIVVDSETGGKTAKLSIDRRQYPDDNHLQYIYYNITPNQNVTPNN